jgi:hypothetical protein
VQGMRRRLRFTLKLVPFGTEIKQRLGRVLKDRVRSTSALVPDSYIGYSQCPRSDGGYESGEQPRLRRPRGNAELSVSGNHR